jgi:hypothetical protein
MNTLDIAALAIAAADYPATSAFLTARLAEARALFAAADERFAAQNLPGAAWRSYSDCAAPLADVSALRQRIHRGGPRGLASLQSATLAVCAAIDAEEMHPRFHRRTDALDHDAHHAECARHVIAAAQLAAEEAELRRANRRLSSRERAKIEADVSQQIAA